MATRLATQRNFVTITPVSSQGDVVETTTLTPSSSNGDVITTVNTNGQQQITQNGTTLDLQHVLQQVYSRYKFYLSNKE